MSSKPFFGFGWIETKDGIVVTVPATFASKPFFGFGWIETFSFLLRFRLLKLLLNHSSASAGLKHLCKYIVY